MSRRWKSFGRRWTGGMGVLKIREFSWTSHVHCHLRFKFLFNKNRSLGVDKFMKKLKGLFKIIRKQTISEVNLGPWRLDVY